MTEIHAMPNDGGVPHVQLFQKAHQKIVTLDRLDEQLVQLFAKRQEAIEELRVLQEQIRQELDVRVTSRDESARRVFDAAAAIAPGVGGASTARETSPHLQNRLMAQALQSDADEPAPEDATA